ncbi:hypothetical protein EES39_33365 [Streptomyces sp. ADI92-24]|uniref:hypothetical protein n=1 Tax=unclassified Streptomyces TaxID=2593676 RepID=UPI000F4A31FB|nr:MULTISPECIES: hypothetical protein [unclassified Streptomyces]ROQ72932.1 hypothetical protein EDD95_5547 [Streptomyces sp. CEV 2-1]RPK35180.1 hypothetical protein EES39_33365 [Streptomyces sp. ADI92-24]
MTQLELPPAPLHEIDLVEVPRLQSPAPRHRVAGRVSLSTAVAHPLTAQEAAAGEAEWLSFLTAEASYSDYLLLSLTCAFRPPANGDPFTDAAVGVLLESPDEPADRQPIAWSISPKKRSHPVERATTIALSAKLAIVESSLELTPGQGREDLCVIGMGERDSDPEWRIRPTSRHPLIGDETFTVIVKAVAGAPVQARVTVAATIRHRRFGLIPYRADLPAALRTIDLRRQTDQ